MTNERPGLVVPLARQHSAEQGLYADMRKEKVRGLTPYAFLV